MSVIDKTLDRCSGCGACKNLCPQKCITMEPNSEGFLYPKIDAEKCTECIVCEKNCPALQKYNDVNTPKCYAAVNMDKDIQQSSSSGGVFYLLALRTIKEGGVVYGAVYSPKKKKVEHYRTNDIADIQLFMGSKYVQSDLGNSFLIVKSDLENKKTVLFSGTPCQIIGLKSFLRKEYANLITVDVICHGVPSEKLLQKYLEYIETKHHQKIKNINFRCKQIDWRSFGISNFFSDGKILYQSKNVNPYMRLFLNDFCLRRSCYDCYAKKHNDSDITLGDFWGIERIDPKMCDDNGTSIVIMRSKKGEEFIKAISNGIRYVEVDYYDAIQENSAEYESVMCPKQRSTFYDDMNNMTFKKLSKKYLPYPKSLKGKVYLMLSNSKIWIILRGDFIKIELD